MDGDVWMGYMDGDGLDGMYAGSCSYILSMPAGQPEQ